MRWKLQGVSYIVSNQHKLWSTNGFKLEVSFHVPSVKSAFGFIARLRRWRLARGTQPNCAKRWTVTRANNCRRKVGVVPPEKSGDQKLLHLFGFSTTSRLNGEYLLKEDNLVRALEARKFHELRSTNGLKQDRSFYPPSLFRFVPVPVYRTPSMRH